jgi:hypothetical protein
VTSPLLLLGEKIEAMSVVVFLLVLDGVGKREVATVFSVLQLAFSLE